MLVHYIYYLLQEKNSQKDRDVYLGIHKPSDFREPSVPEHPSYRQKVTNSITTLIHSPPFILYIKYFNHNNELMLIMKCKYDC